MNSETFRRRYNTLEHECGHSLQKLLFTRPGNNAMGQEDVAALARHLVANYRQFSAHSSELLQALETLERRVDRNTSRSYLPGDRPQPFPTQPESPSSACY